MWKHLFLMFSISLTAQAQFEDFENVLAPSTLSPKIGIICKAEVMFGTTDLIINVRNGKATQVLGDKKYIYQVDDFVCEKARNDKKGTKLSLKGRLSSVIDISSGKELNPDIKKSSFIFSSYLPTKDGKSFNANSFELSSDVKIPGGSAMNISSKTTNSTKCTLVKGGKFVKEMGKATSQRFAGAYSRIDVDNSDRTERKDNEFLRGNIMPSSSGTTKQ